MAFMEHGWSLKWLHRTIMTSTVYRQTGQTASEKEAIDPENELYWRKPLQRLEAEIIRDRILATSGQLSTKMFGPAIPVIENEVGQIVAQRAERAPTRKGETAMSLGDHNRRSVYVQVRRSFPMSLMRQFDMPVMEVNCEKRSSSTLATQSLMLMNGEFVLEQAEHFARRLTHESGEEPRGQVGRAWQLALNRPASEREMRRALEFLTLQTVELRAMAEVADKNVLDTDREKVAAEKKDNDAAKPAPEPLSPELQALTNLCQSLFASSEFLYVD